MSETILLLKNVFSKDQFEKVVDISFPSNIETALVSQSAFVPSVDEFFNYYYALFYQIPKTGENSHTTLIETSRAYVGTDVPNEEIAALLGEVNSLRSQVLEQQKLIVSLTPTGSL